MKPGLVRTVVPQESVERAEMLRTAQKMAEDIRILKASVEAMHTAQSSVIAELAGKVEHMQRDSAALLSHFIERFDRMEHQIAAVAAAPHGADSVLKAAVARKQARGGRGGAFDPSKILPPRALPARLEAMPWPPRTRLAKTRLDKETISHELVARSVIAPHPATSIGKSTRAISTNPWGSL